MNGKSLFHFLLTIGFSFSVATAAFGQISVSSQPEYAATSKAQSLTKRQQAIVPIASFAAVGEMIKLEAAIRQGLDAGLTVNDVKEVLVQLYAYAGFPRSLNALGVLMRIVEERQQRGIQDEVGKLPSQAIPKGDELLAVGTANQTALIGSPVSGPLFDFAPAIDEYLKTHLFGDIFSRDNLSWFDREIATIAVLAALCGVESQLQSHIHIGSNAGLTESQLTQLAQVLSEHVSADAAGRTHAAITQHFKQ